MHDYVAGVVDCLCEDGAEHAPCLECGSAKVSYVHVGDSTEISELSAGDGGSTTESNG